MAGVEVVANRLGIELAISIERMIAGAEKLGEHKTFMLQDLEAARPMELEPISGAGLELSERLGIDIPHTRTAYADANLLEATSARRRTQK